MNFLRTTCIKLESNVIEQGPYDELTINDQQYQWNEIIKKKDV